MTLAESFARSPFARFVNSTAGRITRVVVGVVLILWGTARFGEGYGLALIIVGIIPLAAGVLDWCFVSALLGGPISGKKVRSISLTN